VGSNDCRGEAFGRRFLVMIRNLIAECFALTGFT
jgi:hypothetical protein